MKDEIQFKLVKKDEEITLPLNHSGYQWITTKALENGIVISIGSNKGFGFFIDERKLREIFELISQGFEVSIIKAFNSNDKKEKEK